MPLRVRFAPSPTGYLHVGGARTALFNWLLARREGGVFVLRIEDTDELRNRDEHVQAILHGLGWLGLDWDEGPFFQSEGVERHKAEALRLLDEGKAYRDFSNPEEVKAEAESRAVHPSHVAREKADTLGPAESDRRAAAGEPFAIRFRVPDGETLFTDLVHGEMRFANEDIDDLVILRSGGTPVYNLAVVSDDHAMGITHVIRGDDHLSNTPKQALLYRALGYPEPVFGHVPLILGSDGRRLSKRHGATAVGDYENQGILPEAMVNFLALLGWNPGDEREVMGRDELVGAFAAERILKKSSVFDLEKLSWLNGRHLAAAGTDRLLPMVRARLAGRQGSAAARLADDAWLARVVDLLKIRARTVDEVASQARPFVDDALVFDEDAVAKHWAKDTAAAEERLGIVAEKLLNVEWTESALEEELRRLAEAMGIGAGKLIHPLRVALTGQSASPGIFEVLVLLGRERALERVEAALAKVRGLHKTLS
ncbi:MAG TPA: glutamate--tRNA ligase [Longimicrobiales bacterium]|nr:glutamate--tRNA ligase [Longimicrobiales bacterium]